MYCKTNQNLIKLKKINFSKRFKVKSIGIIGTGIKINNVHLRKIYDIDDYTVIETFRGNILTKKNIRLYGRNFSTNIRLVEEEVII